MQLSHRILIADDDTEVRLGAVELLGSMGLEILEAGDGQEALDIARRESTDLHLALLDFHMPGCTGLDVLLALREETLEVPCIFWSGDATDAMAKYAMSSGASAFLRKPVRPDELRGEVRRVLDEVWGKPS